MLAILRNWIQHDVGMLPWKKMRKAKRSKCIVLTSSIYVPKSA